jgi:hypothetical protein
LTYPTIVAIFHKGNECGQKIAFPYWLSFKLNCGIFNPTDERIIDELDLIEKTKLAGRIHYIPALRRILSTIDMTKENRKKIRSIARQNKNPFCVAIADPESLEKVILNAAKYNEEEYLYALITVVSSETKVRLVTNPQVVKYSNLTVSIVGDDKKLWTYAMKTAIFKNLPETFSILLENRLNREKTTILPHTAFLPSIIRSSEPAFFLSKLSDYFSADAFFLATELHLSDDLILIIVNSMRKRNLVPMGDFLN